MLQFHLLHILAFKNCSAETGLKRHFISFLKYYVYFVHSFTDTLYQSRLIVKREYRDWGRRWESVHLFEADVICEANWRLCDQHSHVARGYLKTQWLSCITDHLLKVKVWLSDLDGSVVVAHSSLSNALSPILITQWWELSDIFGHQKRS